MFMGVWRMSAYKLISCGRITLKRTQTLAPFSDEEFYVDSDHAIKTAYCNDMTMLLAFELKRPK